MPEYLAPGVFIEERPGPRSISRVSTSTAGFVGMTERGPVEGLPKLVTSFGDFNRTFGGLLSTESDGLGEHGHLPHAVKQFFDQGGSRAFIARAYRPHSRGLGVEADRRSLQLSTGVTARLRSTAPAAQDPQNPAAQNLRLSSLRGFNPASLLFRDADNETAVVWGDALPATGRVTLDPGLVLEHRAGTAHVQLTIALGAENNVALTAREPGNWGDRVAVDVRPRTGAPTRQLSAAVAVPAPVVGQSDIQVQSAAAVYPGAVIEIRTVNDENVLQPPAVYATVVSSTGNTIRVVNPAAGLPGFPAEGQNQVSLCEVDVVVAFGSSTELFTGAWRFVDPNPAVLGTGIEDAEAANRFNRNRGVWAKINQSSSLVEGPDFAAPGVANLFPGFAEDAPLASHPATPFGRPETLKPQFDHAAGPDEIPQIPDYLGDPAAGPGERSAIEALRDEDGISIVAVPGITSPAIQAALVNHAEDMQYRFAVLDGPPRADIERIREHRGNFDSSHAALYYPWLETADPRTGLPVQIPPSGPTIGVYARSDSRVGVHKAPANEPLDLVSDVRTKVATGEQEVLNPEGINAIRDFRDANRAIRVWGARTVSSDPEWTYINVRRLFIMIEHSIYKSTQWVVFEPNNPDLWGRVKSTIETFLEQTWRDGMLFGRQKEDAFYVRCDESTMSQQDRDQGRLVCEIGIAPVKPAEFVIFRIGQFTADRPS